MAPSLDWGTAYQQSKLQCNSSEYTRNYNAKATTTATYKHQCKPSPSANYKPLRHGACGPQNLPVAGRITRVGKGTEKQAAHQAYNTNKMKIDTILRITTLTLGKIKSTGTHHVSSILHMAQNWKQTNLGPCGPNLSTVNSMATGSCGRNFKSVLSEHLTD